MINIVAPAFDVDQHARFVIENAAAQIACFGERVNKVGNQKPYPLDNSAY